MASSSSGSSSGAAASGDTRPSAWNLKHMLAKRLLTELVSRSQQRAGSVGVVLVLDPHTSKVLSSCLRMHDLLAAGVLVLQHLHLERERLDLPAVYFVEPTAEAFELIADDFPAPPPPPPPPPTQHGVQAAMQALSITAAAAAAVAGAAAPHPPPAPVKAPKCQYSAAHLFFTRAVPAARMKQLQSSGVDMRKLKTFVELGADFLAFESRVFLFDRPHTIPMLFPLPEQPENPREAPVSTGPTNAQLLPLVTQLLSVCATALAPGEMPYVRFLSSSIGRTALSQHFAELFDRELGKQVKAAAAESAVSASAGVAATPASSSSASPSSSAVPRNTTILIVDRSLDPLTPLMHEFTFQAMLNDLLKVHGEIVHLAPPPQSSAAAKSPKSASAAPVAPDKAGAAGAPAKPAVEREDSGAGELVLSEEDSLWVEYRHRHIGTVMSGVNKRLKEFASSNKMAQFQQLQGSKSKGKDKGDKEKDSVKDVLKAVAELPEYKLAMKRYSKHVALAEECLSKFKQRNLQAVGELEQSIATNSSLDGHVYSAGSRELREELKNMILDKAGLERPLGVVDKLRLVVIYAICNGGLQSALRRVLSSSLHPDLIDAILGEGEDASHLPAMGVELQSFENQLSRARVNELIERNALQPLALMRYVPVLQGIMEALLRDELPTAQFPYTKNGGAKPSPAAAATAAAGAAEVARRNSQLAAGVTSALGDNEQARRKLLADADADVAHRATGRSARRHKDRERDREPAPVSRTPSHSVLEADEALSAAAAAAAAPVTPHRYIIFMLGGLAFSEMRAAYEVAASHGPVGSGGDAPLLIGSTSALTPTEYLLDLSGLTRKEFYERVLASASVAAAHSITTSEEAPLPAAPSKAKRLAAAAAAKAKRGHDHGEEDEEDVDEPMSNGHAKGDDAMSSSSEESSSDSDDDDPPARGKSANGAAKPKLKSSGKELVFESESDGEDGRDSPSPPPPPMKASAKSKPAVTPVAQPKSSPAPSPAKAKASSTTSRVPAPAASAAPAAAKGKPRRRVILDDD